MQAYTNLVKHVLAEGVRKSNRTHIDTLSTFNYNYTVDLADGFPLLTTKKMSWKNIVVETLWFLRGDRDVSFLHRHGCHFWDPWIDSNGQVPYSYGHYWRYFPSNCFGGSTPYADQIEWLYHELRCNPNSRRLVVSAWEPGYAQNVPLPPCHFAWVLNVQQDRLNLHLSQRSADIALGVPYNIATYSLILELFARFSRRQAGKFAHSIVDAHIYTERKFAADKDYDHVPGLRKQIAREPRKLPKLHIAPWIKFLSDLDKCYDLTTSELMATFLLDGYDPHPAIKYKVAV